MKHIFSIRSILLLLVLLPVTLSDCKKDSPKEKDYYVVDIRQDTDWDYWIIGKGGESFLVQLQNTIPSVIYYKPLTGQDGYSIFLDSNGIPSKAIIGNYIFLFGNFRKTLMDVSVVLPTGEIKVFRDLKADYDFTSGLTKSQIIQLPLSTAIRYAGRAVGVVACGIGLAATIPTGGISLVLTSIGCGATLVGIISEFLPENFEIVGLSATTVGTFSNIVGCINISNPTGAVTCALGLASKGLAVTSAAVQDSENKKDLISAASGQLKTGINITTTAATSITNNTAIVGGTATSEGLSSITERGIYYGTSTNPQTTGTKLQIGSGTGTFSSSLSGLTANTTYYIQAYAKNSLGPVYGTQLSFKTTNSSSGFSETFSGSTSYWKPDSKASWGISSGWYLANYASDYSSISYYNQSFTGSFTYQFDVQFSSYGSGMPVLISDDYLTFYTLSINNSKQWGFWKIVNGTGTNLQPYTTSSYINTTTSTNTLKIIYTYSTATFKLYVNNYLLGTIIDNTIKSGKFGVRSLPNTLYSTSEYSKFDNISLTVSPTKGAFLNPINIETPNQGVEGQTDQIMIKKN